MLISNNNNNNNKINKKGKSSYYSYPLIEEPETVQHNGFGSGNTVDGGRRWWKQ